jgi:hypothetical protein
MNLVLTFSAFLISSIIMIIYYFSVFPQEKIRNWNNTVYTLFLLHLVIVYLIVFVVLYLFIKTIINSKQIYPRNRSKYPKTPNYTRPENSLFKDLYFNQNFNNLFRRKSRIPTNFNSIRPTYIVGDPSIDIPYTEWE